MKVVSFFLMFLAAVLKGTTQNTFNVQSNFSFPFVAPINILPTDSFYYSLGLMNDTTNQEFSNGIIFIKLNSEGEAVIIKKISNPNKSYWNTGKELIWTKEGNLASCGITQDSLSKAYMAVFTTLGDTIFTKEYLSPGNSSIHTPVANSIISSPNNKFYILAGQNNIQNGLADLELYIFRLDESGNVLNEYTYNASSPLIGGSLILNNDGNLIIGACRTNGSLDYNNYFIRTYIFEIDSLGQIQWEYESPEGVLQNLAFSMANSLDGGIVVASGRGVIKQITENEWRTIWNGYIFKLNASHEFVWGKEFKGSRPLTNDVSFSKIIRTHDNSGFIACGNVLENHTLENEELFGSWIVKISNQGDSVWARYYSMLAGPDRPVPNDLKPTHDGGYILVGYTQEGPEHGWIMKLDSFGCLIPGCNDNDGPNAVAEENTNFKLAIFPNPVSDFLNFELRTFKYLNKATFRIIDIKGIVLKEFQSDSPQNTFIVPVQDFKDGVYWLQYFEDGNIKAIEKFIVTKN